MTIYKSAHEKYLSRFITGQRTVLVLAINIHAPSQYLPVLLDSINMPINKISHLHNFKSSSLLRKPDYAERHAIVFWSLHSTNNVRDVFINDSCVTGSFLRTGFARYV